MMLIVTVAYGQNKECFAIRTISPPNIDGTLDDLVWQSAKVLDDFLEQEPIAGANPRFKTEVKILYDDKNLYFGIICYDDNPEKITAREMKWDGYLSKDDYFRIILDTYNDNRNAYWFAINPLSAQNDALIMGMDYSGFNEDWDGVWDVKAKIDDKGWSAEVVMPFSTFRFYDSPEQVWGINFERGVKRFNENYLWTAVGDNKGLNFIAEAGDLKGINGIKRGNPIYIIPYLTAGAQVKESGNEYVHEPGVDVKFGLTETLSLDLTVNTDFAQVESDRAIINLTRFPLSFTEKRDFFLEGVNTFKFNLGGSNTLYYSRKMGISGGKEIPIIGGAKLVGRAAGLEIGFIDLQTAEKETEPSTNYSVARLKYDFFNQSFAGVIFTNKMTSKGYNRSAGADFQLMFNNFLGDKNLIFTGRLAKTFENNNPENTWAGFFSIDYPNDLIDQFMSYSFYQDNFNPAIGFIRQTGVRQFSYDLNIAPRINKYNIKKLSFSPAYFNLYTDNNNELQQANYYFQPVGIVIESGESFYFGIERNFDYIKEDFNIFGSTIIKPSKYWFTSYYFHAVSSTSNSVYGELEYETGSFYSGRKNTLSGTLTSVFSKNLIFEGDVKYNKINISDDKFSTYEVGGRIKVNFSTKVITSVFCQWNNQNNEINLNYRFNWKPSIGSDFYLVVNQLMQTENVIKTKDFVILAKFSWLFII